MRHKIGFNPLGRRTAHRKALKRNMVTSLLLEERITTTQTKAQEVRRMAEKMVTRAKEDSVHNRRMVGRDVKNKKALAKLFTEIGPRFKSRPGGYTRILKLGPRSGDAAEMVLLEFVRDTEAPAPTKKKKARPEKAPEKASAKQEAATEPLVEATDQTQTSDVAGSDEPVASDSKEVEAKESTSSEQVLAEDGQTAAAEEDKSADSE